MANRYPAVEHLIHLGDQLRGGPGEAGAVGVLRKAEQPIGQHQWAERNGLCGHGGNDGVHEFSRLTATVIRHEDIMDFKAFRKS